jgi:hypothetical protein
MLGDLRAQDSWAELETGGGIDGHMQLATTIGLRMAGHLCEGDWLRAAQGGPVRVVASRPAPNMGWIRIPALALGNRSALVLAPGQGLLIESTLAARMLGSAAVVIPALALRHWRGITLCGAPLQPRQLTLSRPALVLGGMGTMLAFNGPANTHGPLDHLPPTPNLSLASAQQLVACLIAHDAGLTLRAIPARVV